MRTSTANRQRRQRKNVRDTIRDVVTFGFVPFRLIFPALQVAAVDTRQSGAVAAWGCWALPLPFTELTLQGRKIFAVSR